MIKVAQVICLTALLVGLGLLPTKVSAETPLEQGFQDMFVTAGYSAAAGAAIGAAVLILQDEPSKHLKFITIGASVGFLGGTLVGGWMAFSPLLADNQTPKYSPLLTGPDSRLIVRPWIDSGNFSLLGVEAGAIVASF